MPFEEVDVCGVKISNVTAMEVLSEVDRFVASRDNVYIVTPNVDHIVLFQNDPEFRRAYERAALVLVDGMLVVWAARFLKTPLKEKVSGSDLLPILCKVAAQKQYRLFFLGAAEGVARKAAEILTEKNAYLNVVGTYSPPLGFEKDPLQNSRIIEMVRAARTDILFVGLGTPKQEKWIARYYQELGVPVSIGIGASFDFVTGNQKRAPKWMQNAGLEWFWRFLFDPKRMWQRYFVRDHVFFGYLWRQYQTRRKNFKPIEKILGIRYNNLSLSESLVWATDLLDKRKKSNIFFLNLDCLRIANEDAEYRKILDETELVLPDGVGLSVATRLFGGRLRENLNGTDWTPIFLKAIVEKKAKIFLFGGREGVAEGTRDRLMKKNPGLLCVGCHSGYFQSDEKMIEMINASGADILLVGMGAPLQEKWIVKNRERLTPALCLGVGGLFDWLSGRLPRAPFLFRLLQLEWFWRVLIDPKRMAKRYLVHGLGFFIYLFKRRFSCKL